METDIQKLQEKFNSLNEDELNKLASEKDIRMTASDSIYEANAYVAPRVLAMYWSPALNGSEVKLVNYIAYKTWGLERRKNGVEDKEDEISFSQMLEGTWTDKEDGTRIIYDYGAGLSKKQLVRALRVLEFLSIIEVKRTQSDKGEYLTNKYKIKTAHDWEQLTVAQKKIFMLDNPFLKVERARQFLLNEGKLA